MKWLGGYPALVEKYYSNGIYPIISKIFRALLGWIPFSIGDIIIASLIFLVVRYAIIKWRYTRSKPKTFIRNIFFVLSIAYFFFNILWGLNYYRIPVKEKLGITEGWEYTDEDLISFTEAIIDKTNKLQFSIMADTSKAVVVPYTNEEILSRTRDGYKAMEENPLFKPYTPQSIKKSLFSTPLSYMGTSGHLNPFTLEAQVNTNITPYYFPYVASHEVAHQIGYAAENEASFIGFLAAINQEDKYFKYSALTNILNDCLIRIKLRDISAFQKISSTINSGIFRNYQESVENNKKYENPLEPYIKKFYSSFLKANSQKEGIKSYGGVVDLLIAYHTKGHLNISI